LNKPLSLPTGTLARLRTTGIVPAVVAVLGLDITSDLWTE